MYWQDLKHIKLFRKRYECPQIEDFKERTDYWHKVSRRYYNFKKEVDWHYSHWYVITYKDGRKELAYFKVWRIVIPHGGTLRRGLLFPRYFGVTDYEHVKNIRLAF